MRANIWRERSRQRHWRRKWSDSTSMRAVVDEVRARADSLAFRLESAGYNGLYISAATAMLCQALAQLRAQLATLDAQTMAIRLPRRNRLARVTADAPTALVDAGCRASLRPPPSSPLLAPRGRSFASCRGSAHALHHPPCHGPGRCQRGDRPPDGVAGHQPRMAGGPARGLRDEPAGLDGRECPRGAPRLHRCCPVDRRPRPRATVVRRPGDLRRQRRRSESGHAAHPDGDAAGLQPAGEPCQRRKSLGARTDARRGIHRRTGAGLAGRSAPSGMDRR